MVEAVVMIRYVSLREASSSSQFKYLSSIADPDRAGNSQEQVHSLSQISHPSYGHPSPSVTISASILGNGGITAVIIPQYPSVTIPRGVK